MTTTPDPKAVREIARDCVAGYIDDAPDIAAHAIGHFGPGRPDDLYPWIAAVRADLHAATVSWPDEQPAAEQDGDVPAGANLLRLYVTEYAHAEYLAVPRVAVRTVLDEREQQAERIRELEAEQDGDVRAVAALLKLGNVSFQGTWLTAWDDARSELQARFADRIAALDVRDAKAGG